MPTAMNYTNLLETVRAYIQRGGVADPTVYAMLPTLVTLAERNCARELKIQGFQQTVVTVLEPGLAVYQKPDRWHLTISMNIGTNGGTVRAVTIGTAGSGYQEPPTVSFAGGGGTGAAATAFIVNGVVTQISMTNGGSGYTSAPTVTLSAPDDDDGVQATATAAVLTTNNDRRALLTRSYEYLRSYWPNDALTDTPRYYADYDFSHWIFAPTPAVATPLEILYYEQPALLDTTNQYNWLTQHAPNLLLYAVLVETAPFLVQDDRIQTWQSKYDRAAAALNGEDLAKILDRTAKRQGA